MQILTPEAPRATISLFLSFSLSLSLSLSLSKSLSLSLSLSLSVSLNLSLSLSLSQYGQRLEALTTSLNSKIQVFFLCFHFFVMQAASFEALCDRFREQQDICMYVCICIYIYTCVCVDLSACVC